MFAHCHHCAKYYVLNLRANLICWQGSTLYLKGKAERLAHTSASPVAPRQEETTACQGSPRQCLPSTPGKHGDTQPTPCFPYGMPGTQPEGSFVLMSLNQQLLGWEQTLASSPSLSLSFIIHSGSQQTVAGYLFCGRSHVRHCWRRRGNSIKLPSPAAAHPAGQTRISSIHYNTRCLEKVCDKPEEVVLSLFCSPSLPPSPFPFISHSLPPLFLLNYQKWLLNQVPTSNLTLLSPLFTHTCSLKLPCNF